MFTLAPERLKRYKDIILLIIKYARPSLIRQISSNGTDQINNEDVKDKPEKLAKDLEELGPTFIKLGQLLSTRPDFLPLPYIEALSRLQDDVKPFPYSEVEEIVKNELGVRISKAFMEFSEEPIAAASLGQVHKAKLHNGRLVAVKVQRPGIRELIVHDLDAIEQIVIGIDKHTKIGDKYSLDKIIEEFRKVLLQELNYTQEAQNLIKLGENLQSFERIIVPQPVLDYSTSKVLTMDFVKGIKVTDISPLTRLEFDGNIIAEDLFKTYLNQILVDGFFHA